MFVSTSAAAQAFLLSIIIVKRVINEQLLFYF